MPRRGAVPGPSQIDYPEQLNRVTTAFRIILIIPIAIVLGILTNSSSSTVKTESGTWVTHDRARASWVRCS